MIRDVIGNHHCDTMKLHIPHGAPAIIPECSSSYQASMEIFIVIQRTDTSPMACPQLFQFALNDSRRHWRSSLSCNGIKHSAWPARNHFRALIIITPLIALWQLPRCATRIFHTSRAQILAHTQSCQFSICLCDRINSNYIANPLNLNSVLVELKIKNLSPSRHEIQFLKKKK